MKGLKCEHNMQKRRANNPGPKKGRKRAKQFPQSNTLDRYAFHFARFREVKGQEFKDLEAAFNSIDWDHIPAEVHNLPIDPSVVYLPSTSAQPTIAEQLLCKC